MTLQSRKDYAISKGLATPGRGRMSVDALKLIDEALANGMHFSDEDKHVLAGPGGRPKPAAKPAAATKRAPKANRRMDSNSKASRIVDATPTVTSSEPSSKLSADGELVDHPRVHPKDAEWAYTDSDGKQHNPGNKAVCVQCHNSLGYCGCQQSEVLVAPFGIRPVVRIK